MLPKPGVSRTSLPRAVGRMVRLGWLIVEGVLLVQHRFPALPADKRQQQIQHWARRVLRVLGVQVSVQGVLAPEARMLVANHVSWLDVMALHSVIPQARFVAKADVRHWPAVGTLVAGAGSLFVDRHRPRLARRAVAEITAVMLGGGLVAVFAEGTTTDGRQVLPFRTGLLGAAAAAACPVQPVALRYCEGAEAISRSVPYIDDDSLVQSLWRMCRASGVGVTLTWLPPRDAGAAHRRALSTQLHQDVTAALGLASAANPVQT